MRLLFAEHGNWMSATRGRAEWACCEQHNVGVGSGRPRRRPRRSNPRTADRLRDKHTGTPTRGRLWYGEVASRVATELLKEVEAPPSEGRRNLFRKQGAFRLHGSPPQTWTETVEEAGKATSRALDAGHSRILVELDHPKLLNSTCVADADFLVEACGVLGQVIMEQRPMRTLLMLFPTERERQLAETQKIPDRLVGSVRVGVLGRDRFFESDDICLLASPCNLTANPEVIEEVEKIHYTSWRAPIRPVILLNPRLTAVSQLIAPRRRRPTFLSDYVTAYFAAPRIHGSRHHQAVLLRSFPHKWQTFVALSDSSVYLIDEADDKPKLETILAAVMSEIEGPLRGLLDSTDMHDGDEDILQMLF